MSTPEILNQISNDAKTTQDAVNTQISNGDILEDVPFWLTRSYLEDCLRTYYKDQKLHIRNVHAKPALGKGENYGGVLTRVKVEYQIANGCTKTGHYIVKTSFEDNEFAKEKMAPYDIFNREMSIYQTVLPKLKDLLHEIGDKEQIFAETLAVDSLRSALIFEDLNVCDFVMPDRLEGLDMELTKIVLRKLAKMHATSAVLNERENGSLEKYDRGMFNRRTDNYAPCFLGLFEALIRRVDQWTGYEDISKKLQILKPQYMELNKRVFDPVKNYVNVLAHGDLWTNNVLVKYDKTNGQPLDVIIIDFQYSAWGSPAIDLFYFFNTSLKEDMHLKRQDELIQHYYEVLADTLYKLTYKAKIPSLHQFHMQMEDKSFYAFNSTCIVQPVQRNIETENADFDALMKSDERAINFKDGCYRNPYCQRMIKKLLPVFERRGLLEVEQ